jgi:hypothetical protein
MHANLRITHFVTAVRQTIGGVCEEAGQCAVDKAECVQSESSLKLCLCPLDHVTNAAFNFCGKSKTKRFKMRVAEKLCVYFTEATNIGALCSIQEQCEVINGWCRGALGRESCICKPNSAPNTDQNYCLPCNLIFFSTQATKADLVWPKNRWRWQP